MLQEEISIPHISKYRVIQSIVDLLEKDKLPSFKIKILANLLNRSRTNLYYYFESQEVLIEEITLYLMNAFSISFNDLKEVALTKLANTLNNPLFGKLLFSFISKCDEEILKRTLFNCIKNNKELDICGVIYLKHQINNYLLLIKEICSAPRKLTSKEVSSLLFDTYYI